MYEHKIMLSLFDDSIVEILNQHNKKIDDYINGELSERLGAKNGEVTLDKWFEAQKLLKEQNFFEEAKNLQKALRDIGKDVKMDMQSNKLHLYIGGYEII